MRVFGRSLPSSKKTLGSRKRSNQDSDSPSAGEQILELGKSMAFYTFEKTSTLTFRVFDKLIVSFLGLQPNAEFLKNWGATDFNRNGSRGVCFLGHDRTEANCSAKQSPTLELTIADATMDTTEPVVSRINDENLQSVDQHLRAELSKEYDIVEWRGSKIRPNKCGIKTLVTRYSHAFKGEVSEVYAVRQELLFEKLVMLTEVNVDQSPHLRERLEAVLRRVELK